MAGVNLNHGFLPRYSDRRSLRAMMAPTQVARARANKKYVPAAISVVGNGDTAFGEALVESQNGLPRFRGPRRTSLEGPAVLHHLIPAVPYAENDPCQPSRKIWHNTGNARPIRPRC